MCHVTITNVVPGNYFIEHTEIQSADEVTDYTRQFVGNQCNKVVKEAYPVLGVINRCFLNKTKDILLLLYKVLVRSCLEYCVRAWRPYLSKDIKLL